MEKILISACLLGEKVRYDGKSKAINASLLQRWQQQQRLVALCPEVSGGLSVPRPAAECQPSGQIITQSGLDVTEAFKRGAEAAVHLCRQQGIRFALLKENSPSCGSSSIYDGHFTGRLKTGEGLTCQYLRQAGVKVFSEHQLAHLAKALDLAERG